MSNFFEQEQVFLFYSAVAMTIWTFNFQSTSSTILLYHLFWLQDVAFEELSASPLFDIEKFSCLSAMIFAYLSHAAFSWSHPQQVHVYT